MATAIESIAPHRMNTDEAAEFLGVKPQTLVNWRCTGQGPDFIRMGGRLVRYSRDSLEKFIEQATVTPSH